MDRPLQAELDAAAWRRSRTMGVTLATLALGVAALVLAGWFTHASFLVNLLTLRPRTGMGLSASILGVALAWGVLGSSRGLRKSATLCGSAVGVFALVKVIQWATGLPPLLDPALHQLLGWPRNQSQLVPTTALAFLCSSVALVLLIRHGPASLIQVLAWVAATLAYLGILGHLLELPVLLGPTPVAPMALPAALTLLLLSGSILLLSSNRGFMQLLTRKGHGGTIARRLLPLALLLPSLLVATGLLGTRLGWATQREANLWLVLAFTAVMGMATLAASHAIQELDEAREAQTRALEASEARYRLILEGSRDPILLLSPERVVQFASAATRTLLGHDPQRFDIAALQASLHPDSLVGWIAFWRDLRAGAPLGTLVLNLTWKRRDGSLVPTHTRVALIQDEAGQVRGIQMMLLPRE